MWLHCYSGEVFKEENGGTIPVAVIDVSDEAALVEQVAREIAENEGFDAKDWKYSQPIARAVMAAVGLVKGKQ